MRFQEYETNLVKTATLAHYAGYTEEELEPVFHLMIDYCSGDIRHEAFHSKYASKKYLKGKCIPLFGYQISLTCTLASLLVRQWSEDYVERFQRRQRIISPLGRDIQSR